MQIYFGTVQFQLVNAGSKSECEKPFLIMPDGSSFELYKENDNPFENNFFVPFKNQQVALSGELKESGQLYVSDIKANPLADSKEGEN